MVRTMEVGNEFQGRIDSWDGLSRWERSELGKDLRRLGLSYGEIMDLIQVKKSTMATWCSEVKLTVEQYAAMKERRPPFPGNSPEHSTQASSRDPFDRGSSTTRSLPPSG